ncbi:MAG: AAA family ATPase, partial [Thermomicrobiales bacterium]
MPRPSRPLTLAAIEADEARPPLLPLINPSSWHGKETPAQLWALEDYIPLRQATYLTGPGSVGKSLLAQMMSTCIATGHDFLGVTTRQAVAVYLTCEDDPDVLHARQKAICDHLAVPLESLAGSLHLVSLMGEIGNELCTFDDKGALCPTARYEQLEETLTDICAGFVALDNVAHLFPEEIARNKVAAQVNLLNRLARRIGGAILFLGHPNKDGAEFSGSTAWENQVRSRLYMGWQSDADPDTRILRRSKSNYSPRGGEIEFVWYKGSFARLADLPSNVSADLAQTLQATADNDIFLTCLTERNKQQRAVSEKRGPNFAPSEFAKMPESKKIGKARLEKAMDRLFRIGRIERSELWKGADRKLIYGLRETAGNTVRETARETRETVSKVAE